MACHNADKGGANQLGPNLWGIVGSRSPRTGGFAFSDALKKRRDLELGQSQQMADQPAAFAPGTKMTFAGLGDPQERADVDGIPQQRTAIRRCRCPRRLPPPRTEARGQQAAAIRPVRPNNGPQKAGKEPVLNTAAAEKSRRTSAAPRRLIKPYRQAPRSLGRSALLARRLRMFGIDGGRRSPTLPRRSRTSGTGRGRRARSRPPRPAPRS